MVADAFELHAFRCPAEEVDAELVFPLEPLTEVNVGTFLIIEDFAVFGGRLTKGHGGGRDRGTVL